MRFLNDIIRYVKGRCVTLKYKGLTPFEVKAKRITDAQKEKGKED